MGVTFGVGLVSGGVLNEIERPSNSEHQNDANGQIHRALQTLQSVAVRATYTITITSPAGQ